MIMSSIVVQTTHNYVFPEIKESESVGVKNRSIQSWRALVNEGHRIVRVLEDF